MKLYTILIHQVKEYVDKVWSREGFLTNDNSSMSAGTMHSHIKMVNPFIAYQRVLQRNHFYDRFELNQLIDLKIDIRENTWICHNEYNKSIIPDKETLVDFLEKNINIFRYSEYAKKG